MSALGKPVLEGDFDTNGQVVVQTPLERVIERSVVVTRTVTETPVKPVAAPKAEIVQDLFQLNCGSLQCGHVFRVVRPIEGIVGR